MGISDELKRLGVLRPAQSLQPHRADPGALQEPAEAYSYEDLGVADTLADPVGIQEEEVLELGSRDEVEPRDQIIARICAKMADRTLAVSAELAEIAAQYSALAELLTDSEEK